MIPPKFGGLQNRMYASLPDPPPPRVVPRLQDTQPWCSTVAFTSVPEFMPVSLTEVWLVTMTDKNASASNRPCKFYDQSSCFSTEEMPLSNLKPVATLQYKPEESSLRGIARMIRAKGWRCSRLSLYPRIQIGKPGAIDRYCGYCCMIIPVSFPRYRSPGYEATKFTNWHVWYRQWHTSRDNFNQAFSALFVLQATIAVVEDWERG